MEFLGVGPMELLFIIILALIILGPRDMQKAGKTLGRWMNTLVKSDTWKLIRQASNKIKYLPNELMRDAGLEELKNASQEINKVVKKDFSQPIIDSTRELEDPFKAWRDQNPESSPTVEISPKQEDQVDPETKTSGTGE